MTLHEYICKYGGNKGFNGRFALMIGVAESSLYKYINLERTPRLDIAMRIALATGHLVSFDDMLQDGLTGELITENFSNIENLL